MRAATLEFLAEHQRTRIEVITDRLVDTIERANPGYRASGLVPRDDLWRSCHDNVIRVLELLAYAVEHGEAPGHGDGGYGAMTDPAYDAARETGARRAEQGLPLDDVLRSFRIGGRLIWDDLVVESEVALDASALREIGTRLWEVVDETSAQVATSYHLHERAAVRADEQQRAELWEGVLSGRGREPGFAHQATRLLDLPVTGDFVVVAAPADLDPATADSHVAPHASAWCRRTSGVVGLVALREESPRELLALLSRLAFTGPGWALGASGVIHGLAKAGVGFSQATLALRAQDGRPGVASFEDRLPEALLLSAPDVAERLVAVWLGPVLALPSAEAAPLLDTLHAWVATCGSATNTAASVHCHRNTVVNRLRRVSDLVGHDLSDGSPPLELDLALRALAVAKPSRGSAHA